MMAAPMRTNHGQATAARANTHTQVTEAIPTAIPSRTEPLVARREKRASAKPPAAPRRRATRSQRHLDRRAPLAQRDEPDRRRHEEDGPHRRRDLPHAKDAPLVVALGARPGPGPRPEVVGGGR